MLEQYTLLRSPLGTSQLDNHSFSIGIPHFVRLCCLRVPFCFDPAWFNMPFCPSLILTIWRKGVKVPVAKSRLATRKLLILNGRNLFGMRLIG
jgi:hypothetical protein